jgi:transposase-like protein
MNKISYSGYRFPPEIIQQAIWLYLRFTLSLRNVEDLLADCVKKTCKRHAVREMEVDPSKSLCSRRLQTAMSCFG